MKKLSQNPVALFSRSGSEFSYLDGPIRANRARGFPAQLDPFFANHPDRHASATSPSVLKDDQNLRNNCVAVVLQSARRTQSVTVPSSQVARKIMSFPLVKVPPKKKFRENRPPINIKSAFPSPAKKKCSLLWIPN